MKCLTLVASLGLLLVGCAGATAPPPAPIRTPLPSEFRPVGIAPTAALPSVVPTPSITPKPSSTPQPTKRPAATPKATVGQPTKVIRGEASWGYGFKGNVVTRYPRGTHIRVCGKLGCTGVVHSWGYGPAKYTGRIADLDVNVFEDVCGPRSIGVCQIRLEVWK
jgi:hypothetical protein